MPLTPCSEVRAADWIVSSDLPWEQLVCAGPAGFAGYAWLRFIPDPAYDGQSENDVSFDSQSDTDQLHAVLRVLAEHTSTPDECYFGLWEGASMTIRGEGRPVPVWAALSVTTAGGQRLSARPVLPRQQSVPVCGGTGDKERSGYERQRDHPDAAG